MPAENRDAALIWDMFAAVQKAVTITGRTTRDAYLADPIAQLALERAVEIIGGAPRGVSQDFQRVHPELPWKKIVGQRHVIAHDYGEIDQERLWNVATTDVPALISNLRAILPAQNH